MKKAILIFLSCTWGALMTMIGAVVSLALMIAGYKPTAYGLGWYFVVGDRWGGVNLGLTSIVCAASLQDGHTLKHETGHALQNCVYGVLTPFIVCIPSAARYWYRMWKKRKAGTILADYDAVWFEGQATRWGYAYTNNERTSKEEVER